MKNKDKKLSKKNFSEWYHEILALADIVDDRYPVKGMLIYKQWGLFIIRETQRRLESLLEENGHQLVLFPVVIPENILGKESKHIAGFENEVFWVTHAGKNKLDVKLALRPTSETPIYEMFRLWIRSHKDLPLKVHQSCAVYRYETKHTRPLIRGREFLWNEGHAAHKDEEDAKKNINEIKKIYSKLIQDFLFIPFLINKRPEWDRFPGATETYAFDTIMRDGKTLQIATVHNLGQNFSKVFDIKFEDETGEKRFVHQTSYGPSFGRLLAALIAIHGDDLGLILPPKLAPIQVVIVPIFYKDSDKDKILDYAKKIEAKLKEMNLRVYLDLSDERPGAKFYYWEMKGVPLRIEIGPRDLANEEITIARRDTKEKISIKFSALEKIFDIFSDFERNIKEKAKKEFQSKVFEANDLETLKEKAGSGICISGWCGNEDCKVKIEEFTSILGVEEGKEKKCVICGKKGIEIRTGKPY